MQLMVFPLCCGPTVVDSPSVPGVSTVFVFPSVAGVQTVLASLLV
jgi:hypothetical protein